MSNILRESGIQKKVLIGAAAAGIGLSLYYGISRLKSADKSDKQAALIPSGQRSTDGSQADRVVVKEVETVKQESQAPASPRRPAEPEDASHKGGGGEPGVKDQDLTVSGNFEKINLPSSSNSQQTSRQVSQTSDILGESFEQLSLSQVSQSQSGFSSPVLINIDPSQKTSPDSARLSSLDSPIENRFEQISISQVLESAANASQVEADRLLEASLASDAAEAGNSGDLLAEANISAEDADATFTGSAETELEEFDDSLNQEASDDGVSEELQEAAAMVTKESAGETEEVQVTEEASKEVEKEEEPSETTNEPENMQDLEEKDQNDIVLVEKKSEPAVSEEPPVEFNASTTTPVFGDGTYVKSEEGAEDFDPSLSHPALVGYSKPESDS